MMKNREIKQKNNTSSSTEKRKLEVTIEGMLMKLDKENKYE